MGQKSSRQEEEEEEEFDEHAAVQGVNICKTLDKGIFEFRIFDHVNIYVRRHTIYGLLGKMGRTLYGQTHTVPIAKGLRIVLIRKKNLN